jgi:hypothetical protein
MKLATRELATLAVFGALWGLVEISLGSFLKSLNIPLSGLVLSAIGLFIAMIGRVFVPKTGSTLFIGVIATFLKLFSLGGVIIGPMVGILTEALVAEIVLTAFGKPRRLALMVTGALGVTWVLVQPFITNPLLFGRTLFVVWLDLLDQGSRLFGLDTSAVIWILLIFLAIHLAIGLFIGWLGWDVARVLRARQGKPLNSQLVAVLMIGIILTTGLTGCSPQTPAAEQVAAPGDTAGLLVSGGNEPVAYSLADLEGMPATQAFFNDVEYIGVVVSTLLQESGFDLESIKAVKAVASDGFSVNYDPSQFLRPDFLVAYAQVNGELSKEDGNFRMVLPEAEGKLNLRMMVELQVIQ